VDLGCGRAVLGVDTAVGFDQLPLCHWTCISVLAGREA
jgi:hypothetical protein